MKFNKYAISILSATALLTASCAENAWNNNELDGFKEGGSLEQVQTVRYTLTDADYATIAGAAANKALAGSEKAAALAAVGKQHYFTADIPAREYAPALFTLSTFPYFTLNDGSAIQLTYNVDNGMPAEIAKLSAAKDYTVTDADYQEVWGSDEDYTPSFAPSHTASASLPGILKNAMPDAEAGDYVIVNYNTSNQDPVFGEKPEQKFELSKTIGQAAVGETISINGIVTGLCVRGFILTDASGSIFCYMGSSFDASSFAIGTQLNATALISSNNKGLQIDGGGSTFEAVGSDSYTYPTPHVFTAEELDAACARTTNELAVYGSVTGEVVISGSNINIKVAGTAKAMGGVYYAPDEIKAKLTAGENVTVTGYFIAIAGGRYCNFVVTNVAPATASKVLTRVVTVPAESVNAVYTFNGSRWSVAANTLVLNPADYTEMGQRYPNLSEPNLYLPKYLQIKVPYAQAEDARFVVYKYYNGSSTSWRCDQYVFDGSAWTLFDGVAEETSQFVKVGGKWMFDPNVTITLPAGRNQEVSTLYFQACVNWVYENIDRPLGSTSITSGVGYVTSYGNNEYYSGTSAYQGNVDLRAASARAQYPAGYEGMSDDEIVALMKKRFCEEVMPGGLAGVYPDATPIEGIETIYTINFSAYNGTTTTAYVAKFKLIAKGKFEFVECDW